MGLPERLIDQCGDGERAAAPERPKLLDLFSGIGGFSLGLERAGFETVAFCEISAKCRHLLQHHWPEVRAYDDICTLTAERLAADGIAVDAICGGFPCQDISFAGKGAGLAGERSGLWRDYARLIRELQPRVVVVENVAALLSRGLGDVLGDLAALGYDAWWDCIPASAVGAPHRRDRLWLVAYARGVEHQGYGDALRRAVAAELLGPALADPDVDVHTCGLVEGAHRGTPSRGEGCDAGEGQAPYRERVRPQSGAGRKVLAHAAGERLTEARGFRRHEPTQRPACDGETQHVADHDLLGSEGLRPNRRLSVEAQFRSEAAGCGRSLYSGARQWSAEPNVGRVAHGVPARVDRLHGLGNAVVPEIPYRLGRAILEARSKVGVAA
jgi:DNA (cytosine-5)-methyltransferase 1